MRRVADQSCLPRGRAGTKVTVHGIKKGETTKHTKAEAQWEVGRPSSEKQTQMDLFLSCSSFFSRVSRFLWFLLRERLRTERFS